MRASSALALATAALLAGIGRAQTPTPIGPGSAAPPLSIKKWLKGEPITSLDADRTYVVEFWATWCGPCRDSIPHLTEMAKRNPDVTFLGVGIWEDDVNDVPKRFVDAMGEKMDYRVAYSGNRDGMARSWMAAAGQNGIPTAFVVRGGQIQWIGHPMSLARPLAEIKVGTFDVAKFKAGYEQRAKTIRVASARRDRLTSIDQQFNIGRRPEARASLDRFARENPSFHDEVAAIRFDWLAKENPKTWEARARTLAASKNDRDFELLRAFVIRRVRHRGRDPLALRALGLTIAARPKNVETLWYAQSLYLEMGESRLALNAVKRILVLLDGEGMARNPELRTAMENRKRVLEAKLASGTSVKEPSTATRTKRR